MPETNDMNRHVLHSFLVYCNEKQFWINAKDAATLDEWMVSMTACLTSYVFVCVHI